MEEGEDFLEFVKVYEDLFEKWFSELRPWSPGEISKQRYAWVRCQGMPLHAWGEAFFQKIVTLFGRYVMMDPRT